MIFCFAPGTLPAQLFSSNNGKPAQLVVTKDGDLEFIDENECLRIEVLFEMLFGISV